MNHFKCFAESPWRPLFQRGSIALIHRWGAGFLAVSALLLGGSSVLAADGTWVGAGSGNYSDAAKWTGGVVAGGTGATATVNLGTSGATTITQDAAVTLGTFQLANSTSGQNFGWSGGGTATSSTVTWATSSGMPQLLLNSWFSKTYTLGSGNLTFAGTQGLIINVGSNVAAPSSGGLSWAGFSGTLTVINGGSGDGTLDPQSGGSLPAQHLSLLPGAAGSVTLGMFASRDQTIGGFDGTSAAYVRNNSTSFSTLTLGSNNDSGDFAGVFGRNVNSASTDYRSNINLTKTGSGTQKFSGTTYSGGTTTVTGGVYLVNGTHRAVVTASGNVAATTGTGGQYSVGGTLGGTGTIIPFDTAGGGVMVNVASGGVLAPGDPSINGGLGSLTLDQTNSAKSVLNFSTGGKAGCVLGAGGANSNASDTATTNEDSLFASVFDQYDTTPSTLNVTGIPYATYDALFFVYDGGAARGGSVTVNGTTYDVRGGAGTPVSAGSGYVQSNGTTGGTSAAQGNYVRFSGLSGNLTASLVASNLGDSTQRLKFAGFQIVSRDAYVAPTQVPAAPTGLTASGGNTQVGLNWAASPSATAYKVYRGGSLLTTVPSPLLSYADTAVTNGAGYTYTVSAVNGVGEGPLSASASATPALPSFTPPKRVVFQYSVPVVPIFSTAYPADPYRRAYLWVPPGLNRIQGVFFSMHNMLEKPMVDDPVIRQACADAGVAIVFVSTQSASPNSPGATNGAPVGLPRNMAMDGDPNNYRSADTISTTAITGSSVGNPSTFTTSAAHGLTTGDVVTISGHNATPAVNGLYTVTVTSATTFTIPVNVTGAGTGGTVGKNQMADVNARSDIRNATQGVRFANQSEQAGAEVQVLLQSLAAESGYSELAYAPIMISGHSAASTFVWVRSVFTSAAMAGRTFGILSNKGTFPGNLTSLSPSGNSYQGIPILHVFSEWVEISTWGNTWLHSDQPSARNLRGGGVNCLLGEVVQPGTGHYDYSEPQSAVFGQFIKSAAATRIPANWPVNTYPTLNTIDPASGYLIDPTKVITGSCQPVAYADWVGAGKDPVRAFWYPDLATAQSAAETQNAGVSRKPQQINVFTVNGSTLAPLATTSAGLASVSPVLLADGTTFKMQAASVNQSIVTRLFNAAPLGIASGPILWKGNDSGAIKQVGPDTFRIYMDRNNPVTNGQPYEPFAIAVHLGDSQYRMADRPAFITTAIPVYNVPGTAQTVTFPTPPNQVTTNLHPITFTSATASSGLPVQYWVASGPYRVDETTTNGETIIPDPIPPKSKLPMRVVIGAWQWGRSRSAARAQTAARSPVLAAARAGEFSILLRPTSPGRTRLPIRSRGPPGERPPGRLTST